MSNDFDRYKDLASNAVSDAKEAIDAADIDGKAKSLFKSKKQRNIAYGVVGLIAFLIIAGGIKACP